MRFWAVCYKASCTSLLGSPALHGACKLAVIVLGCTSSCKHLSPSMFCMCAAAGSICLFLQPAIFQKISTTSFATKLTKSVFTYEIFGCGSPALRGACKLAALCLIAVLAATLLFLQQVHLQHLHGQNTAASKGWLHIPSTKNAQTAWSMQAGSSMSHCCWMHFKLQAPQP
jgi:hypothetical protein